MNVNYGSEGAMAAAARPVGQVEEDCVKLEQTISMVENELARLADKLSVLIVTYPTSGNAENTKLGSAEPPRCEIASRLDIYARRIGSIGNTIMSLSNNVQL